MLRVRAGISNKLLSRNEFLDPFRDKGQKEWMSLAPFTLAFQSASESTLNPD
jgi:hypothetical protein